MAPQAVEFLVRLHHHRHGVPAQVHPDVALDLPVAGVFGLPLGGEGVHVGSAEGEGARGGARLAAALEQVLEQKAGALGAVVAQHVVEGDEPFAGFFRIDIGGGLFEHRGSFLGRIGRGTAAARGRRDAMPEIGIGFGAGSRGEVSWGAWIARAGRGRSSMSGAASSANRERTGRNGGGGKARERGCRVPSGPRRRCQVSSGRGIFGTAPTVPGIFGTDRAAPTVPGTFGTGYLRDRADGARSLRDGQVSSGRGIFGTVPMVPGIFRTRRPPFGPPASTGRRGKCRSGVPGADGGGFRPALARNGGAGRRRWRRAAPARGD